MPGMQGTHGGNQRKGIALGAKTFDRAA